jgi:hypothetical protein
MLIRMDKVREQDLQQCRKAFEKLDVDGSGKLDMVREAPSIHICSCHGELTSPLRPSLPLLPVCLCGSVRRMTSGRFALRAVDRR